MHRDRFRRLVMRSLDEIPREFAPFLENIAIVIEREPSAEERTHGRLEADDDLFGLYVGVPLTERGGGAPSLPDQILIFQGPLERHFPPRRLPREIRRTVVHEVAHHFGIDDARLEALGVG